MRLLVACCAVSIAVALSGCSSLPGTADRPLSVGNGVGSEYGNYAAQPDGETRGPSGERCILFNWDRPLNKDFAVRLRSASCDSAEVPGRMISRELARTVIPLADSNLRDDLMDGQAEPRP